jgi:hypothetical protein
MTDRPHVSGVDPLAARPPPRGGGPRGRRRGAAPPGGGPPISARPGGGFAVEGWLPAARPADRPTAPA